MSRKNRIKEGKKKLVSLILCVTMAAAVPAQAMDFGSGASVGDLFTSGMTEDSYTGSAQAEDLTDDSGINPTPATDPEISATPAPMEEPLPSVTPDPLVSPTPTPDPEASVTPVPTVTPDPDKENKIVVKFADSTGNTFYDSLEQTVMRGDSLKLPNVPDQNTSEGNLWKLEKDKVIDDTFTFSGGEEITFGKEDSWDDYMEEGVLTFYAVKRCKVTLYNNSGTAIFANGVLSAYEGGTVFIPEMTSTTYFIYGWTSQKGGTKVEYEQNSLMRVTTDMDLYIIRYTAEDVMFLESNGSSTSAMSVLNTRVAKTSTMVLPKVPEKTGYKCLGWSLTKNAATAKYLPGKKITVNRDLTFYAVREKLDYSVTFNNNKGTSTSSAYKALTLYADKNQTVTLPELPKAAGYQNIGWTTAKGKSTPVYTPGTKIKVTKNMKFYTVRRKSEYYTVQFFLGNGTSTTAYKKLAKKVEEGGSITFPAVPARSGYVNLGWSTRKNATTATTRTSYTITRNVNFYAVQKKAAKVVLHYNSGGVYSTTTIAEGSTYTLPCVKNATKYDENGNPIKRYTFMGWSTKPYRTTNPEYEAEMKITAKGTINLYAVVYDCSKEEDIAAENLPQVDLRKFKKVIFVGDSRTEYMKNTLNEISAQSGIDLLQGVEFICEPGKGLDWFKTTGYNNLCNIIQENDDSSSPLKKPTAVIFNLGVNDLKKISSYIFCLKEIAEPLEKKGCQLYYMSVNPINRSMLKVARKSDRSEAAVREFNSMIQSLLSKQYTYIDTYSYLKATGYGFDNGFGYVGKGDADDGLHYTPETYKRIYRYCLDAI